MKQHGDDARRQERNQQVAMCLKYNIERANNENINGDNASGERAIDERAVDQNVDIEEMRAEHGDPDGDGDEQQDAVYQGVDDQRRYHGAWCCRQWIEDI